MANSIWLKIKEIVQKMLPKKSIENVLHITPAVSDRMSDAIQLWADMYEGNSPWLKSATADDPVVVKSLGLPQLIASEKARMVTLEMKTEITAPEVAVESVENQNEPDKVTASIPKNNETKDEKSNQRADFLEKQYKKLKRQIRRQLEYGIAKGGLVIKPYIVLYDDVTNDTESNSNRLNYDGNLDKAEIEFDYIQADRFFPLSFDANGKVIEAAFVQTKEDKAKERVYIRLEYHKLNRRRVTVTNMAFESTDMSLANTNNITSASNLGSPIPLSAVDEWSTLAPETIIDGVDRLLFAYFKMPDANTVDPYSPLGVSGYSRVVSLIEDADTQFSRLLWEFEGGELAIDVDRDALKFVTDGNYGHSVLPRAQQRLFRKVDLNSEDTYNVFAPTLRDYSLINGLNTILMRIEDACGLSRGTMSDVNISDAKTATELKIIKQRSYATNADIQTALQDALDDVIYVMDVYSTLYEVTPPGDYEVSYEWDDSIIVDSESELSKRMTLMQNGIASKLETRMWYFGETESQAKAALAVVDEEAKQSILQNQELQAQMADNQSTDNEDDDNVPNPTGRNVAKAGNTTSSNKTTGQQADNLENPKKTRNSQGLTIDG